MTSYLKVHNSVHKYRYLANYSIDHLIVTVINHLIVTVINHLLSTESYLWSCVLVYWCIGVLVFSKLVH